MSVAVPKHEPLDPESQAAFTAWQEAEDRAALTDMTAAACHGNEIKVAEAAIERSRANLALDVFVRTFQESRARQVKYEVARPSSLRTVLGFTHG